MRPLNVKREIVKMNILGQQLSALSKELQYVERGAVESLNFRIASVADEMRKTADKLARKAHDNYLYCLERSGEV